jgi:hypothetical protein
MENAARFPQPSTTPWKTSDVFLSPLGNQALRPWFPTAPPPLRRRFTKWLSSPDPGLTAYRGARDAGVRSEPRDSLVIDCDVLDMLLGNWSIDNVDLGRASASRGGFR